ncbi:hypothetical protein NL108_017593 [Boleophthalmus pectinirostris]|nr:hypothetical protein NL108_017593 [Boleophthalmus pectinirostris]
MGADGKEPVNTVPVKVWLLPLEVFKYEPVPVTKGISVGLVLEAEETLKDLENITMRCNECLSVSAVGKFPELQQQVHKFSKLCRHYSVELQGQMAETCPAIREGTVEESVLRSLFDQRLMSPFSQDRLTKWLEDKEMEISMVQFFLDIMEGFPVLPTQAEVYKFVLAPGDEVRCVYAFTSLGNADPQLEEMGQYLNALKSGETYEPPQLQPEHPWFKKDEVVVKMWKEAVYFQQNKDEVHLCVTAKSDTSLTGYAINAYKDGVPFSFMPIHRRPPFHTGVHGLLPPQTLPPAPTGAPSCADQPRAIVPLSPVLGLPRGLLPVGRAQNTS